MLKTIVVLHIVVVICCTATVVDYSNSSLTAIPPSIPANCTELNLSYNMLKALPGNSLSHLVNLTELDLSHNPIDSIETDFLKSNDQLEKLLCESCFDCTCFQTDLSTWLDWVVSTLSSTSLSCRDGRNLENVTKEACTGSTSRTSTISASSTISTSSTFSQTTTTGHTSTSPDNTKKPTAAHTSTGENNDEESTAGIIFVVFEVLAGIAASVITIACIVMVKKPTAEDTTNLTSNSTANPGDGRNIEERVEEHPESVEMDPLGNRDEEIGEPSNKSDSKQASTSGSKKETEETTTV